VYKIQYNAFNIFEIKRVNNEDTPECRWKLSNIFDFLSESRLNEVGIMQLWSTSFTNQTSVK